MANCTYHASALDPMLTGATQLLKPGTGELVIVSSSPAVALRAHHKILLAPTNVRAVHSGDSNGYVGETRHQLQVEYETTIIDLTQQFTEGFSKVKKLHLFWITLCSQNYRITLLNLPNCVKRVTTSVRDMIVIC